MNEIYLKKGGVMQCPVCQGDMWDNRNKKRNPKAPDFRCKDENCTYTLNAQTGEYELGDFPTGVWYKEPEKTDFLHKTPPPILPKTENHIDNSMKSMLMSYAKDIIVAQINEGKSELGVAEVIQDYKKLLSAL